MITKECKLCGKEFNVYKSTKNKKKYCSYDCRFIDTSVENNCLNCGELFRVAKSRYNGKLLRYKCCSSDCYLKLKREQREHSEKNKTHVCASCGKVFVSYRSGKKVEKFCSQDCSKKYLVGERSATYKTGVIIGNTGYKSVKVSGKYVLLHRVIMEKYLGRKLRNGEVVHHKDGNKLNNNIENLQVMSKKDHDKLHYEKRRTLNAKN